MFFIILAFPGEYTKSELPNKNISEEVPMPFYQRIGSSVYHTTTACSRVPENVSSNDSWKSLKCRPKKAKKCPECTSKEKKK